MKVSMTFTGWKEMARALRGLPEAVSLNVQRQALRKAAEPMRAEAAALAPRGPDAPHIADNIVIGTPAITGVLADLVHESEQAVVAVGPQKNYFYGLFWEFGWIHHAAHPFMRPPFDTKVSECLSILGRELWTAIERAAKRLFVQQGKQTTRGLGSGGVGI